MKEPAIRHITGIRVWISDEVLATSVYLSCSVDEETGVPFCHPTMWTDDVGVEYPAEHADRLLIKDLILDTYSWYAEEPQRYEGVVPHG